MSDIIFQCSNFAKEREKPKDLSSLLLLLLVLVFLFLFFLPLFVRSASRILLGINNKLFRGNPFCVLRRSKYFPSWLTRTQIVNFNNENARDILFNDESAMTIQKVDPPAASYVLFYINPAPFISRNVTISAINPPAKGFRFAFPLALKIDTNRDEERPGVFLAAKNFPWREQRRRTKRG